MSTIKPENIGIYLLTISDTRTKSTDVSGKTLREKITSSAFPCIGHQIIRENSGEILQSVQTLLKQPEIRVIISSGGTGLGKRDITIEELAPLFDRELKGFGELFRMLSYQQVAARCLLSRATAGLVNDKMLFILPGSPAAVELAVDKLILPVLLHMFEVIEK